MRCEITVGTEKCKRLVGVSLNAINYKHGARGEITFFNHRAKRVNIHLSLNGGSLLQITTSNFSLYFSSNVYCLQSMKILASNSFSFFF